MKQLVTNHTCRLHDHVGRTAASRTRYLQHNTTVVAPSVESVVDLGPSDIRIGAHTALRAHVSTSTAGRAAAAARKKAHGTELESFQKVLIPRVLPYAESADLLTPMELTVDVGVSRSH